MQTSKKIVFNTIITFSRALITVLLTLYTTRLILKNLGIEDFGIFSLIGGFISLLSFLNAAMATSTQRFISYNLGKNNLKAVESVFANSIIIHFIIALGLVLVIELAGLYFINNKLNINPSRLLAANYIFHFAVLSTFITIISVPYDAVVSAHENFIFLNIMNVLESILKLIIAIFISYSNYDKLILYGILLLLTTILIRVIKRLYCNKKYDECKVSIVKNYDKTQIREQISFASWGLIGSMSNLGRTEGVAIMLNLFQGTVVNAAFGIAQQITSQLNFFSASLLSAINPQIMKSEGANDRTRMLRLSMTASKFGFFLLAFIGIPCLFELNTILSLWLKVVPNHTLVFCSLMIISTLVNQLTIGLQSAAQAIGRIKLYQAVIGSLLLLNVPCVYYLLKIGFSVSYVLISYVIIESIAVVFRLFFLKKIGNLSLQEYFRRVFYKEIIPIIVSVVICYLCVTYLSFQYRFLFTLTSSIIAFCIAVYLFGLCEDEKLIVKKMFSTLKNKIKYD